MTELIESLLFGQIRLIGVENNAFDFSDDMFESRLLDTLDSKILKMSQNPTEFLTWFFWGHCSTCQAQIQLAKSWVS